MQENSSNKRRNIEIGKKFEKFVSDNIYPNSHYDLISVSPEYNERFIHDNLKPDLKLRRKNTTTEFWVECKFRSDLKKNYVSFKKDQIDRYKKDINTGPLTYILGFGGTPDNPKIIFSIPFCEVLPRMEISEMERYIFNTPLKIEKNSGEWSFRLKEKSN